jgi:hypothetical protein
METLTVVVLVETTQVEIFMLLVLFQTERVIQQHVTGKTEKELILALESLKI